MFRKIDFLGFAAFAFGLMIISLVVYVCLEKPESERPLKMIIQTTVIGVLLLGVGAKLMLDHAKKSPAEETED